MLTSAAAIDCDRFSNSTQPQGVHLAFVGNASTSAAVSFFTCGAAGKPLVSVHGGIEPLVFAGTTSAPFSRQLHDVLLAPLAPATRYTYQAALQGGNASETFAFATPPADADAPFTAAVVGDMGVNGSAATFAALAADQNFTIHIGDVSYADDYKVAVEPSSGRSYEAVYDTFMAQLAPIASRAPYMVTPGNHDVTCKATTDHGCPQGLKNFSAFRHRWRMPSVESNASAQPHHNMWYSWRVGRVHFSSLSTESDYPGAPTTPTTVLGGGSGGPFGDQLAWLRADLAAARADPAVTWVVVLGHRPWYASKSTDWPVEAPTHARKAFDSLFDQFAVDLYLCGHKHYYERTVAVRGGKADANGTVHVINGAAGNNEGVDKGKGVGGLIAAVEYKHHGYGLLDTTQAAADGSPQLRWRYILSDDRSVHDEIVLSARARPALARPRPL
jgi:hypothetical protein